MEKSQNFIPCFHRAPWFSYSMLSWLTVFIVTGSEMGVVGGVMAVVVIIVVASIGVFVYRRKKFEQDLELMLWRVNYNEITFLKNKRNNSEFGRGVS